MTRLFKNSKQIFAFVMAFAIVAVSLFVGSINASALDTSKVVYWNGTKASKFESGDGSKENPYIIKTAEQLAYCCTGLNPDDSTGRYYKVDDSVKFFIMQPENVVDLQTLLALDSAEATKEYLSGLSGLKNWASLGARGFNGNFDGNGATVYGIWADGITTKSSDVGLFPRYDGGYVDGDGNVVANVCKNIAVKNSYFSSVRRVGAISGASYSSGYDAKIDGIIHYDTIAVVNCYITTVGNINYYGEQGIVIDGGAGDVSTLNNILVKGNYAYNTEVGKNIGVMAASNNAGVISEGVTYKAKLSNAIVLGTDPFRRELYSDSVLLNTKVDDKVVRTFFENVVTDQPAGKVTFTNPSGWGTVTTTAEFTEDNVKQVTATGFQFKQETSDKFDWENDWFMSENGPELRAFHGEIKYTETPTTHVWECVDCGLTSPGGIAEHEFALVGDAVVGDGTDVYACAVCGYVCTHGEQTDQAYDPGNCVTASGVYSRCKFCDWYIVSDVGVIPGHKLTYVEADPGHCEKNGHLEYWECSVCQNKFASDDVYAPMNTAVTDEQLDTGLGTHLKAEDDYGIIVLYDETGHWYICAVDGGRLDHDSNVIGEDEVVKHKFKNAACTECDYVCTNHDFVPTGNMAALGDCFNDEKAEIKCTLCGLKASKVTKPAAHDIVKMDEVQPNDQTEGTKAHYKCKACKAVFSDAEGKVSITKAELVIPKTLPAEYDTYYPQNADTSTKSPTTGDSFVTALALAAFAGASLTLGKKVR